MMPQQTDNQRYVFDPFYGFVRAAKNPEEAKMEAAEVAVEAEAETPAEEVKAEAGDEAEKDRFYFHPYLGFVPAAKLMGDEKLKTGVNMDMKYILHPYFGFVPESKKKLTMPYNPFGYKVAAHPPKKYTAMYNSIGEQMKAMTAAVAEPEAKADEAGSRKKRSPVVVVPVSQGSIS
jgi:hypothetical protein